jgi:hypothetical protein
MKHVSILLMIVSIISAQSNQRPFLRTAKSGTVQNNSTLLNINRLSAWYSDDGESERNPNTGNSGVFFPSGNIYDMRSMHPANLMGGYVSDGVSDSDLDVTGFHIIKDSSEARSKGTERDNGRSRCSRCARVQDQKRLCNC